MTYLSTFSHLNLFLMWHLRLLLRLRESLITASNFSANGTKHVLADCPTAYKVRFRQHSNIPAFCNKNVSLFPISVTSKIFSN